MADLVVSLLIWIGSQLNLAVELDSVPAVRFASGEMLVQMAFAGERPAAANHKKVLGLYDFQNQIIYLAEGTDLKSGEGKAVLVHELVHFLQYQHGVHRRIACIGELEPPAYLLESVYRSRHGIAGLPAREAAHGRTC